MAMPTLAPMLDLVAVDGERRLHRLDDALGDRGGVAGLVDRAQQQRELVAAEAGEEVGLARRAPEPRRGLLQHLVADGVAERVVDRLEVVEVDAEHRGLLAARRSPASAPPSRSRNCDAVGQLGQRVVARQVLGCGFLLALLGDVLVGRDPAAILHRMVLHQDDAAVELVDGLAVLAARDDLAPPADVVLAGRRVALMPLSNRWPRMSSSGVPGLTSSSGRL